MIRTITFVYVAMVLLGGCATMVSESNLYWGNYSHTLYQVKKNPGIKTKKAHQDELSRIIEKSKKMKLRVPPGVYAELGMYAKENGDNSTANTYFQLEQDLYPEFTALKKNILDI